MWILTLFQDVQYLWQDLNFDDFVDDFGGQAPDERLTGVLNLIELHDVDILIVDVLSHDIGEYFEAHEFDVIRLRVCQLIEQNWNKQREDWLSQNLQSFIVSRKILSHNQKGIHKLSRTLEAIRITDIKHS